MASSRNWVYDVFPSFSGEDVRVTFLCHFLKELDQKLIIAFKDNEIERSRSLDPELRKAIKDSRIAVVLFSKNYASSSWCLNELLEIVKCKKEFDQMVIPVFYGLDPSHVRKQTGDFGNIFKETCLKKTEDVIIQWKEALTDVANMLGYHSVTWGNEATMIEAIANDILSKLLSTPSVDFDSFVGIDDHIANMSKLLELESEEMRMVGIWGCSGIGKTTIARVMFNHLSRHFQGRIYIDKHFVSKITEIHSKNNSDDYNMKLHLQEKFLSKLLGKEGIEVSHLGAAREKLERRKVLIFVDDLDDQVMLDALVGETSWFGRGSRIVAITKDKHLLRSHGIVHIYQVRLPSDKLALQMFCQSAFRQDSPPEDFRELASEVVVRAGRLPLGLHILGSSLHERNKKYWVNMLPSLGKGLDGKIEKALRVSYDALERREYKTLFRHIACFFKGYEIDSIKLILADCDMNVDIGLEILLDKSLIHINQSHHQKIIDMHSLVEEMGKELVREQSDDPGKREFVMDSKDVCDVLQDKIGTKKLIGISVDMDENDELHMHNEAFQEMRNLRFLHIHCKKEYQYWNLPQGLDYLPPKLKLLSWKNFPWRCMPCKFLPQNLVILDMQDSKFEKMWDGTHPLARLKKMDLRGCKNLKEIPDLSMATNLEKLSLSYCDSLVELPYSIQYLHKLEDLDMQHCVNLVTLPIKINLKSLNFLNLGECFRLRTFPDISSNVSELVLCGASINKFPSNLSLKNLVDFRLWKMRNENLWKRSELLTTLMGMMSPSLTNLWLQHIPSLVELPSSFKNLHNLRWLVIIDCVNFAILPTGINIESLYSITLRGCSRLTSFPDISTNVSNLDLSYTAIEEVPTWIENFSKLRALLMENCNKLEYVYLNISKMTNLTNVDFNGCGALTGADLSRGVAMEEEEELPALSMNLANCFNLVHQEALVRQQSVFFKYLAFPGEEMSSYFTHQTNGTSLTIILPIRRNFASIPFFGFRACALVDSDSSSDVNNWFDVLVYVRFVDGLGSEFVSPYGCRVFSTIPKGLIHKVIFDCFPLSEDNAPPSELKYDHVDIRFHFGEDNNGIKLKGFGVRLSQENESIEDNDRSNEANCIEAKRLHRRKLKIKKVGLCQNNFLVFFGCLIIITFLVCLGILFP